MWGHTRGGSADRQTPKGWGAGSELTQTPTPTPAHSVLPVTTGIPLGWAPTGMGSPRLQLLPQKPRARIIFLFFSKVLFPFVPALAAD